MKTFINDHPFIALGVVWLVCDTAVRVTSVLKGKPRLIFLAEANEDVVETTGENKQEA